MSAVSTVDELEPERLEQYRRELTGYCYRMLGSLSEAEDAVQETMIRAWRSAADFEGRSSARTWLHRVATNVCLDMLRSRKRRALPMGLVPSTRTSEVTDIGPTLPESAWVLPAPDASVLTDHSDPALVAAQRETVRLAFVAALQHLPARQRAVLLLREVMGWSAAEVAELLDSSVASVNSALQRARATLAAREPDAAVSPDDALLADGAGTGTSARRNGTDGSGIPGHGDPRRRRNGGAQRPDASAFPDDGAQRELLAKFLDAFERYDIELLTSLLREDAVQSMPPWPLWIVGPEEVGRWMLGPGAECRGSRLLPVAANGTTAFAQYRSDGRGGHAPFAIQMLTLDGDRISQIHSFVMPELFASFGLPPHL